MHNKVQKPLRKGSLIDILDYRRHLQRQIGGDKRSFVESYYAADGCKGGREGTAEHRLENEEEDGGGGGRTVALRFIQNGLDGGDNGRAQSTKRKPNPGRLVPPSLWKLQPCRSQLT